MKLRYVIRSLNREEPNNHFCAIHGFTPFFGPITKARNFDTIEDAAEFADKELFTSRAAYVVFPMKTAKLKFIGEQPGFGRIPDVNLYNIVSLSEPSEELVIGSTVTFKKVSLAGYVPEIVLQP